MLVPIRVSSTDQINLRENYIWKVYYLYKVDILKTI